MKDSLDAAHAASHPRPIGYRTDMGSKWGLKDVEANDLLFQAFQGPDQRFAQMTGTPCNQDSHFLCHFPYPAGSIRTLASDFCMSDFGIQRRLNQETFQEIHPDNVLWVETGPSDM
jgi:hypothetical protein